MLTELESNTSSLPFVFGYSRGAGEKLSYSFYSGRLPASWRGAVAPSLESVAKWTALFGALLYRHSYQSLIEIAVEAPGTCGSFSFTAPGEASLRDVAQAVARNLAPANSANSVRLQVADAPLTPAARGAVIRDWTAAGIVAGLIVEADGGAVRLHWLALANAEQAGLAERLHHGLCRHLVDLKTRPTAPLAELDLLSPEQLAQLEQWGTGPAATLSEQSWVSAVEATAAARPSALALTDANISLNYGELNRLANGVAAALIARGLLPGERVAVCLGHSALVAVTLLALHKCALVYVPLDPNFPAARLQAILEEVTPALLIVDEHWPDIESIAPVRLLELLPGADIALPNPPAAALTDDTASHIFFTSGTTGRPKGVLASHKALRHYLQAAHSTYGFNSSDRMLAAARLTFSISLFEWLVPLAAGASVHVLERRSVLDFAKLAAALEQVTAFHFGPSLLKQLFAWLEERGADPGRFAKIRHASSGGDRVAPEVLTGLNYWFGNAEVFVIYGSSEIACMGATWRVPAGAVNHTRVGNPMPGVKMAILDAAGCEVPAGIAGELHVAGPGLAIGYLNQPALTASKFHQRKGERFYAIGDVGRFDADGSIELLGRHDFQVQIRGMRIELGEVEQRLKAEPSISDAVMVARSLTADADASLVAYVVPAAGQKPAAKNLSEWLAAALPDYMLPAAYVQLPALPVNHNGKLDRSALPAPSAENMLTSDAYRAPADAVESSLVIFLQQLFELDRIGAEHNFFELGGDSLQAVRWLAFIDQTFEVSIPIDYLLNHPTAAALAQVIRGEVAVQDSREVVVLKYGDPEKPTLFCLYGVLIYRHLARALPTDNTVCGVYLDTEVSLRRDGVAAEDMGGVLDIPAVATEYLRLITEFQPQGPYRLCGLSFGGIVALEVAHQLRARGEVVDFVGLLDSNAPGHLSSLSATQKLHMRIRQLRRASFSDIIAAIKRRLPVSGARRPHEQEEDYLRRAGAAARYTPPRYDRPVVLFRARQRDKFDSDLADLGWKRYCPQLNVFDIAGDHLSMLQPDYVKEIAERLGEDEDHDLTPS